MPGNSHCLECVRARLALLLSLTLSCSNVCVSLCICTRLSVFAELLPGKMRGGEHQEQKKKKKKTHSQFFFLLLSFKQRKSDSVGPAGQEAGTGRKW